MKNERAVAIIFGISAAYDGLLGAAFLIAPRALYTASGVTPPNHWGYVQFPALILVNFGLMFYAVAMRPRANRNLIPYGILLKVSYAGVVFFYWFTQGLPDLWKPFAVIDAISAALFAWAWMRLGEPETAS